MTVRRTLCVSVGQLHQTKHTHALTHTHTSKYILYYERLHANTAHCTYDRVRPPPPVIYFYTHTHYYYYYFLLYNKYIFPFPLTTLIVSFFLLFLFPLVIAVKKYPLVMFLHYILLYYYYYYYVRREVRFLSRETARRATSYIIITLRQ